MSAQRTLTEQLAEAERVMRSWMGGRAPKIGLVLGSGLNALAKSLEDAACIDYGAVPYMGVSTASLHVGRFVCGTLDGTEVLCMQGRIHGYEGYSAQEVAFPIWLMARLGIETVVLTNAAGAVNGLFQVGEFCIISDHLNLTGQNPLVGAGPAELANPFPSMTDAFDPALRTLAHDAAGEAGVPVREGVYAGLLGPSLETPAEIRMLRVLGADLVGMSSVWEAIAARHVGMRVLGISLVSNMAAGIGGASPSLEEVAGAGEDYRTEFERLVRGIVARL